MKNYDHKKIPASTKASDGQGKKIKEYNHAKIERKWQLEWDKKKIYQAKVSKSKKFYALIEFPYLSGSGLHVGHIRSNTAMDIISRKRRMEGFNVSYPIGYDAFGLPTENYAIKTGKQPTIINKENTDMFRRQLKKIGFSFDWSREINTADPTYYKWTQWIFLQFLKKGLAYKAKSEINWCPKDKTGLANEEVVDGKCERCGTPTIKKEKEQWMLAITKYADRLDKDLDLVDYPERVKSSQKNWIGKSEGSEIDFKIISQKQKNSALTSIKVFTTRADTLFGATYVVLAPEHNLITNLKLRITNWIEVEHYINSVKNKSDLERNENKEKTGVELKGIKAINPANSEEVSVWVADYVLTGYGTGAIMAVPAHDNRDREFAEKYNLPILDKPFVDAKEITEKVGGKMVTKFKLRDWVFSRQRYWGEPIPVVICEKCGIVPVKEKDLPVKLPKVKSYKPTDNGESPLAAISSWVNTKCPKCKGKAKRETDTMPNWAGSSWYYLRYTDPKNKKEFASKKNLKYWTPVDWYNGGMEHTTLHLLYSRFWHKFLYDLKLVPTAEPYKKRTAHGMILGDGGVKMSKSIGNVVNPDEIVKIYGADTLRVYEMFMGPFEDVVVWNTESIIGSRRFVEKVWRIGQQAEKKDYEDGRIQSLVGVKSRNHSFLPSAELNKNYAGLEVLPKKNSLVLLHPSDGTFHLQNSSLVKLLHKTIKKVEEDIEAMRFNTAVSAMMILATEMESAFTKGYGLTKGEFKMFLKILAPFAPHVTEEIWRGLGEKKTIHLSDWPKWDKEKIIDDEIKIAIQINGKVRDEMMININDSEDEIKKKAVVNEVVIKFIAGSEIKKIIYVKNRLVNIVL